MTTAFHWARQRAWSWGGHFPEGQPEVWLSNCTEHHPSYLRGHRLCTASLMLLIAAILAIGGPPRESDLMAPVQPLGHHSREAIVYFGTENGICSRFLLWEHPERLL